jgi:hypothetical protein
VVPFRRQVQISAPAYPSAAYKEGKVIGDRSSSLASRVSCHAPSFPPQTISAQNTALESLRSDWGYLLRHVGGGTSESVVCYSPH